MMGVGLLMLAVFGLHGFKAFGDGAVGVYDVYVVGGFALAGVMLSAGFRGWRQTRADKRATVAA